MDETTRLLLAARDGDRFSLAAWIRRTQPEVWRLCSHLVDHQAADDLTQETYLRAWRALPAFRAQSSARTWLLTIARRTCADALRVRTRQRRLAARLTAPLPQPDHADELALQSLLKALDPDRREAFVLTQLLGLTYDQAAQVCGCAVGTIRSRVARARTTLITSLQTAESQNCQA
jgi:RNA polymerase sigma-70 factor (ECF subfamily)